MRCPRPLGSCSPACLLGVLCCACGVVGHLAPVHRCAHWLCCFACAVSWASWLLFTGVPARCVVLRVRCPGPLGSCSPVCLLRPVLCLCGVLGHLAPVHRCAHWVCCFACAVSWASWLLFTGVPARCVVLRVRCPGPLGSCSAVCLLRPVLCLCGVLGHLAPVHRCARSVCSFACAVSWATWLLFTGVPARCVVLRVRCPGPPRSCSPVCPLGVLFYVCGVLGHLAPVHRCARSVCCFACAVSWATWLLFTSAPARWVVLRVRCPGPLGSCSPVCPLGGLRCVYGVLGCLALVHRCARSVCCAVGCACGVPCVGRRCGALTRPSGRRLFVAGRGWVPSGRALVHPDGGGSKPAGAGYPPGAHSSIWKAAGVAWHLFLCHGLVHVVRALRVCGTRWPLLLGTCPCALVVAGGVPIWRASWPRVVRRASSGAVALGAPVGFPDAVLPFPTPGACAPGFTGWLRGARGGRPRTGLIVPAAGPRRGRDSGLAPRRTRSGPRDGVVPGGSLRRRSWAACAAVSGVCGPSH